MTKTKSTISTALYDDSLFRIVYCLDLFLSSFVFVDVVAIALLAVAFPWAYFIFKRKIKDNAIRKIDHYKILCFFLICTLVTSLLHVKMSFPIYFLFDLIMIYHYAICFFILYGAASADRLCAKREILSILKFVILFTTVTSFVSLLIIPFKDQIIISGSTSYFGSFEYVIGIYKRPNASRFTGFFDNPNILAFCSVLSLIFMHILFKMNEFFKKSNKILQIVIAVFCVSINLLGLILSDSIASFILLIFYLTFYALFSLIHRGYMDRSKAKNAFLFSCVFLAVSFIVTHIILQGGLQSNISSLVNCFFDKFDKNINFKFGRSEYDLKYGSGRKILIDQALIIFKNNPIWGIGISNIEKFGNLYFDTGIAFPNYILGIAFPNFHNGYLTILACYGLLGFLVFLLFFIKVFATFFAGFLKKAMELNFQDIAVYKCLLAFLCSYLIFALFEKTFLSEINFMGITFWVILGYLMNLFHHLKNEGRSNI